MSFVVPDRHYLETIAEVRSGSMTEGDRNNRRPAGKVLWHVTMSLDGFITGPDDAMDWVFSYKGTTPAGNEVIRTTGAILAGRRMYDLGIGRGNAKPYGGAWTGPIFVLTHRPSPPPDNPAVTFLSDGIEAAIATALAAAEGKNLVLFGATIPQQCLEHGLVDEIVVHLAPILLGDGIRLFGSPGAGRVSLERIGVAEAGQLTDLRFRIPR